MVAVEENKNEESSKLLKVWIPSRPWVASVLIGIASALTFSLEWHWDIFIAIQSLMVCAILNRILSVEKLQEEISRSSKTITSNLESAIMKTPSIWSTCVQLRLHFDQYLLKELQNKKILPQAIHNKDLSLPIEAFKNIMRKWVKIGIDKRKNKFWNPILYLYMIEEVRDFCEDDKIATNVVIYCYLLESIIRTAYNSYGDDTSIFILTSLLPSEWKEIDEKWSEKVRVAVRQYKEFLKNFIVRLKTEKRKISLSRIISVMVNRKNIRFPTLESLHADLQVNKDAANTYIDELHFDDNEAGYCIVDKIFSNYPHNLRDILVVGNSKKWEFAIRSELEPTSEIMFVEFYDIDNMSKTSKLISGLTLTEFINEIKGKKEFLCGIIK